MSFVSTRLEVGSGIVACISDFNTTTVNKLVQKDLAILANASLAEAGPILLRLLQSAEFREYTRAHGILPTGGYIGEVEARLDEAKMTWCPPASKEIHSCIGVRGTMVYGDEISVLYYMKNLPVVTSLIESDEETEDEYERYYRPNSLSIVAEHGSDSE